VLTISQCDGSTRGDEIKSLFVRNERTGFPHFFERVYRTLTEDGGASWIATDEAGAVVMHVAVFPRVFSRNGQTFRAALLGDLIADVSHRDFWSPVKLVRRAIADIRREGRFDFLYTDPSPNSIAVAKAAGFTSLGDLRRYVAPVNSMYLTFCGIRSRTARASVDCGDQLDPSSRDALRDLSAAQTLSAERSAHFYMAHAGGQLAPQPRYVTIRRRAARSAKPQAIAMLAGTDAADTVSLIDLRWDGDGFDVGSALHAVAHTARRHGYRKLSCATLDGSRFAHSLSSYGFFARECIQPVFVLALHPSDPPPPAPEWMLTSLDGSAW
jgi:hypothetical protein